MTATATAAKQAPRRICNGVDATAIEETVAAVKADPKAARFSFRAANRWQGGSRNRSTIKGFVGAGVEDTTRREAFTLDADEPPVLLGQDQAANPAEYVLHALAACLTTTLAYQAAARGIAVEAIDSTLEGDMDLRGFLGLAKDVRKGFGQVRVAMRVKSAAKPETLRELAMFSPVYDIVSNSVPVELDLRTY